MKNATATIVLSLLCLLMPATQALAVDVALFAAASLKDVVNDLSEAYMKANPGVKIIRNFGGSGTLAMQIENGAPGDLFIPASQEWMEHLRSKNLADATTMSTFAYNTLVFVGAHGTQAGSMQDLPRLERVAIGSPKSVPAGEYAMEALNRAGIGKLMEKRLVMARDVRECLMYAERGEVNGAFVYKTDALQAKLARVLFTVPQQLYTRISYPMALTISGARNRAAVAFRHYLQGAEAGKILLKYGFATR
jgi:molybdate transport system substrate-binding protein